MAPSAPEKVIDDEDEEEERWANHYSSLHEILLVGEGDFSFSFSLANTFGSASNIVATSLDSHDTVVGKYAKAKSNLETLLKMGAMILHGLDATKMKLHTDLKMRKFDRIIFNFPHAGFKGKEDEMRVIKLHRQLVEGFFHNASHMLRPNGEVHVTHKTKAPYNKWNLEELASNHLLLLTEYADFNINSYPGYNNKRGDGVNQDQPFRLGRCCTFKFCIGDVHELKKAHQKKAQMGSIFDVQIDGSRKTNHPHAIRYPQTNYIFNTGGRPQQDFVINVEGIPPRFCSPPRIGITRVFATDMEGIQRTVYSQPGIGIGSIPQLNFGTEFASVRGGILREFYSSPGIEINSEPSRLFRYHLEDAPEMVRRFGNDSRHADQGFPRIGYEVYMNEELGRSVHGYYMGNPRDLEIQRREQLRRILREGQDPEADLVR